MSCGMIKIKNKKVLLVGGGEQAYKTACELLIDGAMITCVNESFISSLQNVEATLIETQYHKEIMEDSYFMAYGVSENRELNHQVVMDANERGIISASYHNDEDAVFKAMKYQQYEDLTVALSTSGKFPAFTKTVFDEIEKVYTKRYEEKLKYLGLIREYIIKENIEQKYLLKDLLQASNEELKFYSNAIRTNKAYIFVFHGVNQQEMYAKILRFIEAIGYDKNGVYFSYIDDEALQQYHYFEEINRILSLEQIKKTLHLLKLKDIVYQPMLFEKGINYHKMMDILKGEKVNELLFDEKMLKTLLSTYLPSGNNLLVLPALSTDSLKCKIESLNLANVWVMSLGEKIPVMDKKGVMNVTGFFMLIDLETSKQVYGKNGIFVKLVETDYDAEENRKLIIEDDGFRQYIREHMNF